MDNYGKKYITKWIIFSKKKSCNSVKYFIK